MKRSYDSDMTKIAQQLRRNATPEESKLWYQYLRSYPVQFKLQKPIGRYVLDFYCTQAKLAIELDGAQHFMPEGMERDENRTAYLNSLGIAVLRFTNREVNSQFEDVCHSIDAAVHSRMMEAPHPSSR